MRAAGHLRPILSQFHERYAATPLISRHCWNAMAAPVVTPVKARCRYVSEHRECIAEHCMRVVNATPRRRHLYLACFPSCAHVIDTHNV